MRTTKEITVEIAKLEALKDKIPARTLFGDDSPSSEWEPLAK